MANPDKRTSHLTKLVSAARSIVTYQTSLPLGCTRIHRILYWLRPFEQLDMPVFDDFLAATQDLPIGTERLQWSRDALRERDVELERIIRKFRDRVFDACYDIIDCYAMLSEQPREII
ncbi:MAG: hypothetical protein ACR2OG_07130 [Gemmatimonadaceae bacterium]